MKLFCGTTYNLFYDVTRKPIAELVIVSQETEYEVTDSDAVDKIIRLRDDRCILAADGLQRLRKTIDEIMTELEEMEAKLPPEEKQA